MPPPFRYKNLLGDILDRRPLVSTGLTLMPEAQDFTRQLGLSLDIAIYWKIYPQKRSNLYFESIHLEGVRVARGD